MLDDRDYMRSPEYSRSWGGAWRVSSILMVTLIVIGVLEIIMSFHQSNLYTQYLNIFALSPEGIKAGHIWQLVTFQFMHGGLWHLLGNCIIIYFFGRTMEEVLGEKAFLKLYFSSGIIGGLFQVGLGTMFPDYFGGRTVGASAGAFGLLAAFAWMFPNRLITLLLFFVIPVSFRAIILLYFELGITVLGILAPKGGIAHAAHLGGILTGMAFVSWFVRGPGWSLFGAAFRKPARRPQEPARVSVGSKRGFWSAPKAEVEEELPADEFISREVDPILDKISQHGIHSLTERERKILEKARAKMSKR
ncbi:MAG: rhomboid family intramembrane serine protease [Verrucomicrobiota bacterium]